MRNKDVEKLFIFGIIFGIIVHGMIIFNDFPNNDGIAFNYYTWQNTLTSGRWLLGMACLITGPYTLTVVNGVVAIIFVVLSALLIIDIFKIQNRIYQYITMTYMISFPALGATFLYMFTVDGYMLGLFLSILSIWIIRESKISLVVAVLCLMGSIAIYQAYISVTMVLCILLIIKDILQKEKKIIKNIISYIKIGIGGSILYYIILKILLHLFNTELVPYQGINTLINGGYTNNVLLKIKIIYVQSIMTIYKNIFFNKLFLICFCISYIILMVSIIKKLNKQQIITIIICIVFLPVCLLTIYAISPDAEYHLLMKYAWVLIFIYIFVIAEFCHLQGRKNRIVIVLSSVIIYGFILSNNTAYEYAGVRYQRTLLLANRIEEQLETGKYDLNKKIGIFYEGSHEDKYKKLEDIYPKIDTKYIDISGNNIDVFMKQYFTSEFRYMSIKEYNKILDSGKYDFVKIDKRAYKIYEDDNFIIIKVRAGDEN